MADYKDYCIYTKLCICKKDLKNFKIFLSYYDESGACNLCDEEKSNFSFRCAFCNFFNGIDFDTICNQYAVRILKSLTIDRQIQEKVNEILQIKLMKLKIQKF